MVSASLGGGQKEIGGGGETIHLAKDPATEHNIVHGLDLRPYMQPNYTAAPLTTPAVDYTDTNTRLLPTGPLHVLPGSNLIHSDELVARGPCLPCACPPQQHAIWAWPRSARLVGLNRARSCCVRVVR